MKTCAYILPMHSFMKSCSKGALQPSTETPRRTLLYLKNIGPCLQAYTESVWQQRSVCRAGPLTFKVQGIAVGVVRKEMGTIANNPLELLDAALQALDALL